MHTHSLSSMCACVCVRACVCVCSSRSQASDEDYFLIYATTPTHQLLRLETERPSEEVEFKAELAKGSR